MADERVATSSVVLPRTFVQTFRRVAALPDDQLRAINLWAKSNPNLFSMGEPEFGASETIGVPENEFLNAHSVIYYFLFFSDTKAPDLGRFLQLLKSQGLGDSVEKARILLDGLLVDPSRAEYVRQRSLATQSVLPTLSRVDAVCDLRGVFRAFPSPNVSKPHIERMKTLLGFEPIAIMSVTVNDAAGDDHVNVFQCTRNSLQNVLKTLKEVADQMDSIAVHKPLKGEGNDQ